MEIFCGDVFNCTFNFFSIKLSDFLFLLVLVILILGYFCISCWSLNILAYNCMHAQSCLTPHDPTNCSPPGSSVHGISQEIILEWVAISFSRGSSWPWNQTCVCALHADYLCNVSTIETSGKPQAPVSTRSLRRINKVNSILFACGWETCAL